MSSMEIDKATLDAELLEGCPSLAPRPNARNIKELEDHIVDTVSSYPAITPNPPELGYTGAIKSPPAYAIDSNQVFVEVNDPGDVAPSQFSTAIEEYKRQKKHFNNQTIVTTAVKKLLSKDTIIPKPFRTHTKFPANVTIQSIFANLRANYGAPTAKERSDMEAKLNQPYDPSSKAIEVIFEEFKQVLLWSLDCEPAYTEAQIVQKLHDRFEQCGHFALALEQWQSITPKTWISFREHMIKAYTTYCNTSGNYTSYANGYVNNVIDDDERSLQSLQTVTQELMNQAINMNNANVSRTNSSLSTLDSNQQTLNTKVNEMAATLHQLNAALSRFGMGHTMPAYPPVVYPAPQVPAPPSYVPQVPPVPPTYVPQAGTARRGGRGRGRGGRGRGGNAGGGYIPPILPPNDNGSIPPPAQQYQQPTNVVPYSNTTKYFNNHNMCYSCGHDVAGWHTSVTCPPNYRKQGHQEGCNHTNWQQYEAAGHKVSQRGKHKIGNLPTNPGPRQA